MNKRKGISLIVLVITILVMIILSGVVIVSLQKNNPIEKAKEAAYKTKIATIIEQIELEKINDFAGTNNSEKRILWDSPFNYQLIGSVEQGKIEKELGRKGIKPYKH